MILTLVEGDQPHVAVICRIVHSVKQLFKCPMVLIMPWNCVHIPRLSINLSFSHLASFNVHLRCDCYQNCLPVLIKHLQTVKTHVEEIAPAFFNVDLQSPTLYSS
jgi:hypothetical protein